MTIPASDGGLVATVQPSCSKPIPTISYNRTNSFSCYTYSLPLPLTQSSYSFFLLLTSQNPRLPSPFPPKPPSNPRNAYGSPSLRIASPSRVYWPSGRLPSRDIWPAHFAASMGRRACEDRTMPVERRRMERRSSRVMSVGRGEEENAVVCSCVE